MFQMIDGRYAAVMRDGSWAVLASWAPRASPAGAAGRVGATASSCAAVGAGARPGNCESPAHGPADGGQFSVPGRFCPRNLVPRGRAAEVWRREKKGQAHSAGKTNPRRTRPIAGVVRRHVERLNLDQQAAVAVGGSSEERSMDLGAEERPESLSFAATCLFPIGAMRLAHSAVRR